MNPIRSTFWLSVGLLAGGAGVFAVDAKAAPVAPSQVFGSIKFQVPGNLPVSAAWDAVVPGTDWTYDYQPQGQGGGRVSKPLNARVSGTGLIIDVGRNASATNLAKAGRLAARSLGPLAAVSLALDVLELMWDEDLQDWTHSSPSEDLNQIGWDVAQSYSDWTNYFDCGGGLRKVEYSASYTINVFATLGTQPTGWAAWPMNNGCSTTARWYQSPQFPKSKTTEVVAEPATDQHLEDAIEAELIQRNFGAELARRLIDAGYVPDMEPVETSGPASVPGETTVSTTETSSGTDTTTTTTTFDINYNGDTVTIGETTVSTTVHADNSVTTITNTSTPSQNQQQIPEPEYTLGYADSPFGEVPQLYEQKYPDGLEGVWDTRISEIQQTPFFQAIGDMTSGAPSSGTCPSWTMNLNFGPYMNFGSFNVEPPCFVWPFVRIALILTAFFVARRLVFGG